jgi:hypothetical protein
MESDRNFRGTAGGATDFTKVTGIRDQEIEFTCELACGL